MQTVRLSPRWARVAALLTLLGTGCGSDSTLNKPTAPSMGEFVRSCEQPTGVFDQSVGTRLNSDVTSALERIADLEVQSPLAKTLAAAVEGAQTPPGRLKY